MLLRFFKVVIKERLLQPITLSQYGYMRRKSTTTVIVKVVNQIFNAINKREILQIACCDLTKTFDTVDGIILLTII